jgi:hypothetical protein
MMIMCGFGNLDIKPSIIKHFLKNLFSLRDDGVSAFVSCAFGNLF